LDHVYERKIFKIFIGGADAQTYIPSR